MISKLILVAAAPTLAASLSLSEKDFATREKYVKHLNALPEMTWTAGVNERFKDMVGLICSLTLTLTQLIINKY